MRETTVPTFDNSPLAPAAGEVDIRKNKIMAYETNSWFGSSVVLGLAGVWAASGCRKLAWVSGSKRDRGG